MDNYNIGQMKNAINTKVKAALQFAVDEGMVSLYMAKMGI